MLKGQLCCAGRRVGRDKLWLQPPTASPALSSPVKASHKSEVTPSLTPLVIIPHPLRGAAMAQQEVKSPATLQRGSRGGWELCRG